LQKNFKTILPYCWLEQVHYWNGLPCMYLRMLLLKKHCNNGKIRSHVQCFFACKCFWSFFPTWHYRLVVNSHALKSRFAFCLHIFAGYYIRRVCINLLIVFYIWLTTL
jgi:hypothetical protein